MKLDTKINLIFTNPTGGQQCFEVDFNYLIDNDTDGIYENLEPECTSASCNNESQNFCDCGGILDDYEITAIQII